MNKWESKLLKSFVIGGAVIASMFMNSNNSMAAEVETNEAEIVQLEQVSEQEPEQKNEKLQELEDVTEVIEGDAEAEEGYSNQAKEEYENGALTQEKAEELKEAGQDVMDQAKENEEKASKVYDEIKSDTEEAQNQFGESATENGLGEYADECNELDDNQKKIEYLNKFLETIEEKYREFEASYGVDSEKYAELIKNIQDAENEKENVSAEYAKLIEDYNNLEAKRQEVQKQLDELELSVDDFAEIEELQAEYNRQLEELNNLKEEFEKSCARFEEVYYARESYEEQINQAEAVKNDYLEKIRKAVENGADNIELTALVNECVQYIQAYDNAVSQMEKWYSELENAIVDRQTKKNAYNTKESAVKEAEKKVLNYKEFKELIEEYKTSEAEADKTKKEADEIKVKLDDITKTVDDLYALKAEVDQAIAADTERYNKFVGVVNGYKDALDTLNEAQILYDRAEVAYAKTEEKYNELNEIIAAQDNPNEPWIEDLAKARDLYNKISALKTETEDIYNSVKRDYDNGTLTQEELDDAKKTLEEKSNLAQQFDDELVIAVLYYDSLFESVEQQFNALGWKIYTAECDLRDYERGEYSIIYITYESLADEYDLRCQEHPDCIEPYKRYKEKKDQCEAEINRLNEERKRLEEPVSMARDAYNLALEDYNALKSAYTKSVSHLSQILLNWVFNPSSINRDEYLAALAEVERLRAEVEEAQAVVNQKNEELNNAIAEFDKQSSEIDALIDEQNGFIQEAYLADKKYIDEYIEYISPAENAKKECQRADERREELRKVIRDYQEQHAAYRPTYDGYSKGNHEAWGLKSSANQMLDTMKGYLDKVNQM